MKNKNIDLCVVYFVILRYNVLQVCFLTCKLNHRLISEGKCQESETKEHKPMVPKLYMIIIKLHLKNYHLYKTLLKG